MARPRRLSVLADTIGKGFTELPPGPLVVALSGGADSAAAAWGARATGRSVRALHVHHGLPASDVLAAAAAAVASELGLELDTVTVTVEPGSSPEGRARAARYAALAAGARLGELVVTAHTADDQAETVLARVLRGSGFDGLAGIPPIRLPFVRPLLGMTRAETRELATLLGLPWRDDPANDDLRYLRNVLRRRVIPELEGGVASGLRGALVRSAEVVRTEVAALDELSSRIRVRPAAEGFRMVAGELRAAEAAVAARAVRAALAAYRPPHPPSKDEVAAVLAVAGGGGRRDLSGGWRVSRWGPWVEIASPGPTVTPPPVEVPVPGEVLWGGFRLSFTVGSRPGVFPLSRWAFAGPIEGASVVVRSAAPGDRIAVARGHKSVAAALAEGGVPVERRDGWPVVELDGAVTWIPGVRRVAGREGARYLCGVAVVDDGDEERRGSTAGAGEEHVWGPSGR